MQKASTESTDVFPMLTHQSLLEILRETPTFDKGFPFATVDFSFATGPGCERTLDTDWNGRS